MQVFDWDVCVGKRDDLDIQKIHWRTSLIFKGTVLLEHLGKESS